MSFRDFLREVEIGSKSSKSWDISRSIDIDKITDDISDFYKFHDDSRINRVNYSASTKAYIIRMLPKIREKIISELGMEGLVDDRTHEDWYYRSIKCKPGNNLSFHPDGRFYEDDMILKRLQEYLSEEDFLKDPEYYMLLFLIDAAMIDFHYRYEKFRDWRD